MFLLMAPIASLNAQVCDMSSGVRSVLKFVICMNTEQIGRSEISQNG